MIYLLAVILAVSCVGGLWVSLNWMNRRFPLKNKKDGG